MNRFILYNPNPDGKNVGDCTVRALSCALNQSWEKTFAGLTAYGFMLSDMPSANHVWGAYLRSQGFRKELVDDHGKDNYTVYDFCADHESGVYVLAVPGHVVSVIDGRYYDTWDSGNQVPQYLWTR